MCFFAHIEQIKTINPYKTILEGEDMALRAGIPLISLFDVADRLSLVLPDRVRELLTRFAAIEHKVTRSSSAIIHHGRVQLDPTTGGDLGQEIDVGFGSLRIPALQNGIPFQLSFVRKAASGGQNLEPSPDVWKLDLVLDAFDLAINGLRPAVLVPEIGTAPRHLIADLKRSDVRISGKAVLRIEKPSATANVSARLVDQPDPLDPMSETGFVASVLFTPPHFFIGGSQFGLTVGRILYDASEVYTPAEIVDRGQSASWMGLSLREATVFAPRNLPVIGDLSGGIRDLLIGDPMGIQGQLEVQFGVTALNPSTFLFEQVRDTGTAPLTVGGTGRSRTIQIQGGMANDVVVQAGLQVTAPPAGGAQVDWTAKWNWPDGSSEEAYGSQGTVRHGQTLNVQPIETITDGGTTRINYHPEVTFRFVATGTPARIDAQVLGEHFTNVVHLSGTHAQIAGVTLQAVDAGAGGDFEWYIDGTQARTEGFTYTPQIKDMWGAKFVVLSQKRPVAGQADETLYTHLLIDIRGDEETPPAMLIGTEGGVFASTDDAAPLALSAVEATYDLSDFHAEGTLNPGPSDATLDAAAPFVDVPNDGLAKVTLADSTPAAPVVAQRRIEVLMNFDMPKADSEATPTTVWQTAPLGRSNGMPFTHADLLEWANRYPGGQFLVIGRCDDLGSSSYNTGLATRRADYIKGLFSRSASGTTAAPIDASRVFSRGEQNTWSNATPNALEEDASIALPENEQSEAVTAATENGWLIRLDEDRASWPATRVINDTSEAIRQRYRRVDILVVGGTPATDAQIPDTSTPTSPVLRRSWVPANGRTVLPAQPGSPSIDYRVKLVVGWDSPTVTSLADAIPTLAEFEYAWTPQDQPLPSVAGQGVDVSREVLTVSGKWVHDPRTGYTNLTIGIESDGDPDGLVKLDNKTLTSALAFGPVLMSGVDTNTDLVGSAARMAALLGAVAFAEDFLGDASKTVIKGVSIQAEFAALSDPGPDSRYRAMIDYTCTLHVNAGVFGIKTADDRPVKIRYKNVGIEFDTSQSGWDQFGLVYDTQTLEIEDPGKWKIDGVLGQLLRITEVTMGRGSIWFEGTIAIGITLGVVKISEATIRLTWEDGNPIPRFELRGFVLNVDIPATLTGEGRLRIEDGGVIRAGVDCTVIPAGLAASAALALANKTDPDPYTFLSLSVGVQFSTPLPLAQSGLAIYGLKGMFTMNGERALPSNPDPIQKELDWFAKPPEQKYSPKRGQHAIGFGAVVGTFPDLSFSFSCEGMLAVGFPDPEVIFGIKAKIISLPDTVVKDQSPNSALITGLIVIDDEAVKVGIRATYEIPKVVKIEIPFSAYFPYPGTGKSVYVRIGSDGVAGRFGNPVTVTVLPGTLDAQAWSYLMVEGGGLPTLGGDARFSFSGFAIGFGAGWGINWSAGPIKLSASAKVLIGFGTDPLLLKGGIFVAGELSLVVISISARGSLILELRESRSNPGNPYIRIDGEFCGKVDLFFFDIEGCVGFSIGSDETFQIPAPDSPVKGIALTDRTDRIMGMASKNTPQANAILPTPNANGFVPAISGPNNTVWPDTAPVISFAHGVINAVAAGGQFAIGAPPTQPLWSGSSELKYAFRLDNVRLRRRSDGQIVGTVPLQTAWMSSPYRQPDVATAPASEHEGPNLKLLDWNPWAWTLNLPDGGAGQPGDPVTTIETICTPRPQPARLCLFGENIIRQNLYGMVLYPPPNPATPYPSHFQVRGQPQVSAGGVAYTELALRNLLMAAGGIVIPGAVSTLAFSHNHNGRMINVGYMLPRGQIAQPNRYLDITLPFVGRFAPQVVTPSLLLMVCDAPFQGRPEGGGQGGENDLKCDFFKDVKPTLQVQKLDRDLFTVVPMDRRAKLRFADRVQQNTAVAVPGSDGSAEVVILARGIRVVLKNPASRVDLHVMMFGGTDIPVLAKALGKAGDVLDEQKSSTNSEKPEVMTLKGNNISEVILTHDKEAAVLYRVCVGSGIITQRKVCEDFSTLPAQPDRPKRFTHNGITFETMDPSRPLLIRDAVDDRPVVAIAGRDDEQDIIFPDKGVQIDFAQPIDNAEVHVMQFGGGIKGEAFDGQKRKIASTSASGVTGSHQVLTFNAQNISTILVTGGGSESAIFRICRTVKLAGESIDGRDNPVLFRIDDNSGRVASTDVVARLANVSADSVVLGVQDNKPKTIWLGTVLAEKQGRWGVCRVIEYKPTDSNAIWDGFEIRTPQGKIVTLMAVCGVDLAAITNRQNDQAIQQTIISTTTNAANTPPNQQRVMSLAPNTEYEILVDWSWQGWRAANAGDVPPAVPPAAGWTAGTQEVLRFKTANVNGAAGLPQDGLNEYVFDVRDVSRYLLALEPSSIRTPHFTNDPLWAHFNVGHIEELLKLYKRTLTLEVRRTDPKPQAGGAAGALMEAELAPLPVKLAWKPLNPSYVAVGYDRINEAIKDAPCIPGTQVLGGSSLAITAPLEPYADYDLIIAAIRESGAPDDGLDERIEVSKVHFRTSRYASASAYLAALGYEIATSAPQAPDDYIIPDGLVLSAGVFVAGDAALDAALAAIDLDTLPLPKTAPRNLVLWSFSGGAWRVEGLLIDSLEPLKKEGTILSGNATSQGTLFELLRATIPGKPQMVPVRANDAWTRVLLKPSASFTLNAGADTSLALVASTPSGNLQASRRLGARPAILAKEGL
jgi:hypothetical protein